MAPAAELEAGALLMNAQLAAPMRAAPEELGFPQPAEPMKTGSSAASGIMSGVIKQQRSKAAGMALCWLKGRAEQGKFRACWAAGDESWEDHFAKPTAQSITRS